MDNLKYKRELTEEIKEKVREIDSQENRLLPRRREVLGIIKDHPECSFDFIYRRFMGHSRSAIHRDLAHLQKSGLIRKLGDTWGAVYVANADIL